MKLSRSLLLPQKMFFISYAVALSFAVVCMTALTGAKPALALIFYAIILTIQSIWMFPVSALVALCFRLLLRRTGLNIPIVFRAIICGLLVALLGHFILLPRFFVSPTQPWCHDAPSDEGLLCFFTFSAFGFQPWFISVVYGCAGGVGGFLAGRFAAVEPKEASHENG